MNLIYSSLAKSPVCQIGTELEDIKLCEGWRGPGESGREGGEPGSQAPAHRLKPELEEDLLKVEMEREFGGVDYAASLSALLFFFFPACSQHPGKWGFVQ